MNISVSYPCSEMLDQPVDCLIAAVTEEGWDNLPKLFLPWQDHGVVQCVRVSGEFSGKAKQTLLLHGGVDDEDCPRLLVVGLGKIAKLDAKAYRSAAALAVQQLRQRKLTRWAFDLARFPQHNAAQLTDWLLDGVLLELYRFDCYKNDDEDDSADQTKICCGFSGISPSEKQQVQLSIAQREIISHGVWLARNLVNEPGNVKTPEYLAKTAWNLAEECGFTCNLLGLTELERQGFGALLAVAKGSICEPRLIVMEHHGAATDSAPIALVGKGVTFDSGGISLKPGEGMQQMKMDMAGGASVIATMATIARLQLPINVVGVVPVVENMPSDRAARPGDIVTSLSGKTIEIINTDAEGRLILADALTWVGQKNPELIVDLATLTGACIMTLGHHVSAVLSNDSALVAMLQQAGDSVDERLWELPLFDDYAEQIKSTVADVKNVGGRPAGTITAAAFLQKFVGETPWAHLDIAGTAWEDKGSPGHPTGATGVGVRLLVEYLQQRV
ncbi:MAG: leucyl aminopeptidase [Thermodesulfobacteriota bacterium]|nr:leucyl aminopeptidase [Thermodesulfobacteriota bacterium]